MCQHLIHSMQTPSVTLPTLLPQLAKRLVPRPLNDSAHLKNEPVPKKARNVLTWKHVSSNCLWTYSGTLPWWLLLNISAVRSLKS